MYDCTPQAASLILKKAALVADEAGQRMRLWEQTVKGSEQPAYSVVGPASVLKPPPESLIQLTQVRGDNNDDNDI